MKRKISGKKNVTVSSSSFGFGETTKCRERLAKYCSGYGLDLGFGGDPISLSALRMDMETPYTKVGNFPVQLGGNAEQLYWFKDEVLDYVFSSHLLEDFVDTEAVLREWLRVLKPGGRLILFCPDEQLFRQHCKATGQAYNAAHIHEFFSLAYIKGLLHTIGTARVLYEKNPIDIYSWDLVCEKL